ncbi:polysaccharide pyruvyl transferase family protein [Clostridium sp. cel8]|uniref:polysaccharide pyruvyl transferase family protein n=1 Tax=Clostridium sp. cel8 TaxID=2663123 RepID=UPI0015F514C8|nr:polysaccharide pyruvyl transferase family protein [Clostridium sp. cel8]MBA5850027.1 polysaccharide pyruvyl transferase family protein [Clostridium sp. cel8]
MNRVAILTINDYNNYGNRLQNYATQEVLKDLELSVKTIVTNVECEKKNDYNKSDILHKMYKLKNMPPKLVYEKIKNKAFNIIYKNNIQVSKQKRLERFKKFTNDNICETKYYISQSNIPKTLKDEFDYFVVGSDQVWNPTFRYGSSIDFLTFAPPCKRIAYAPSFGIDKIPSKYINDYAKWLSQMHRLSVREESGARIIKDLTNREAQVLIDPTLMLSKEKWLSISKKDKFKPKYKYLLTYFLGDVSQEIKKKIKKIAKRNNLLIVNLASIRDLKRYQAGPSEFIDYINSASVLFTDSFHGCVFSILLGTAFVVFEREGKLSNMNSRIDTLLKTFKLQNRKSNNILSDEQIFEANYDHITSILEVERKKSLDYLKEALNIKND